MNNLSSLEISNLQDEYPEVTQADLDHAVFRVGLKSSPSKQSITIDLDANLIAYFKLKAGEEGYQSLINEVLRQAISQEELQNYFP
ncbi:MAG: BrnA antitoxin family protein [Snowella sp.]|nr:BrnA antitoxin family protein [Snowella sp.]